MLAEHPDVLARLRNEVLETVGPNGKVGPESLKEMKYLRAVLDGKRFMLVQRSPNLICHRDSAVVSEPVCVTTHPCTHNRAENRTQSVECQMLQERGGMASS